MIALQERGSRRYSRELHILAYKPQFHACYTQCIVNGTKFVIFDRDENLKTQNSGVMVQAGKMNDFIVDYIGEMFVSTILCNFLLILYNNFCIIGDIKYYGVLENIIELQYAEGMPVVIFKCKWYNTDPTERGTNFKMDHGLLSIDTLNTWYDDAPYCLATTAQQVFYLEDPKKESNWKIVNEIAHRGTYSDSCIARANQNDDDVVPEAYQEDEMLNVPFYMSPDGQEYEEYDDDLHGKETYAMVNDEIGNNDEDQLFVEDADDDDQEDEFDYDLDSEDEMEAHEDYVSCDDDD